MLNYIWIGFFLVAFVVALIKLVFFQDTGVTGLPVTPSGGDIIVQVDAAGWFIL